jgi:hypothetical protein
MGLQHRRLVQIWHVLELENLNGLRVVLEKQLEKSDALRLKCWVNVDKFVPEKVKNFLFFLGQEALLLASEFG